MLHSAVSGKPSQAEPGEVSQELSILETNLSYLFDAISSLESRLDVCLIGVVEKAGSSPPLVSVPCSSLLHTRISDARDRVAKAVSMLQALEARVTL